MKSTKKEKKQYKKAFQEAMARELREHKSSFIVFSILRILVLVVLVRQIMLANYEGAFFCILTLLLLYVPSWIQVKLRIELPPPLEITIFCFIFAAEILGEVNAFYVVIPGWDTMLHTINGFLAAAVGFSMVMLLNDDDRITFHLSPAFLALVAFCFSMTIGVLWEFFEFGMDFFLGTDMQKDTVIHAIHSVSLDPTLSNKVVTIPDIQDVVINGESLGLGGYLDIGIIDTMKDLFVNSSVPLCSPSPASSSPAARAAGRAPPRALSPAKRPRSRTISSRRWKRRIKRTRTPPLRMAPRRRRTGGCLSAPHRQKTTGFGRWFFAAAAGICRPLLFDVTGFSRPAPALP